MNTNDSFVVSAFRMMLSVLALIIMLPLVDNFTDVSFYVTVSIYLLGKFVDLVAKVTHKQLFLIYFICVIGMIICVVAIGMCFLGFASVGAAETGIVKMFVNTKPYNYTLIIATTLVCMVDVIDFIFCISKLNYTKQKLKQFYKTYA